MFIFPISLTIAAGAALINAWLMMRVGKVRTKEKVSIGDGGNEFLTRRMRAHSNFVESAPFVLILIALLEMAIGSSTWLWAAGFIYLLGRVAHAFGMDGADKARMVGAVVTLLSLLGLAIAALITVYGAPQTETATDMTVAEIVTEE